MAVSGAGTNGEPAVALVSPAGSSAPPQPATEPDTSTANTKSHTIENSMQLDNSTLSSPTAAKQPRKSVPGRYTRCPRKS